jgi:peptidoglycan/LPS O-acetylase OafA/YrhL
MIETAPDRPVLVNVQYLRAIAALIVAITHAATDVGRVHERELGYWIPGPFGVEIFFVISGFIICYANLGRTGIDAVRRFARGRFWRIVPFYWLCTTFYLAIAAAADGALNRGGLTPNYVAASYVFFPFPAADGRLSPVYALGWSLNFELFFYVLFALGMFVRPKFAVVGLTVAMIALALLRPLMPGQTALHFWTAPYVLEFLTGIWIAWAAKRYEWRAPSILFWPLTIALVIISAVVFNGTEPGVLWWSVSLATAFTIVGVFTRPAPDAFGVVGAIGNASFSLYLLHMFVIRGGVIALGITGVYWPYPLTWFALIAASCIVSLLSYRYMEQRFAQIIRADRIESKDQGHHASTILTKA